MNLLDWLDVYGENLRLKDELAEVLDRCCELELERIRWIETQRPVDWSPFHALIANVQHVIVFDAHQISYMDQAHAGWIENAATYGADLTDPHDVIVAMATIALMSDASLNMLRESVVHPAAHAARMELLSRCASTLATLPVVPKGLPDAS